MQRTILHSYLFFIIIYGAMNGYACWKLSRWFRLRRPARIAFALAIVIPMFGEDFIKAFQRVDWTVAARAMALGGYFWMAFLLWFNLLGGLADGWNIALFLVSKFRPAAGRLRIPFRPGMAATLALVALILLYSLAEAQWIRLEELRVRSPHFQGAPLRILQISDVHLGLLERQHRLSQIIRLVERTRPDLIVSSGDLLDGSGVHMSTLRKRLAALQPPLGKIAITGNHEFYNGIRKSMAFHEEAGFRLLRGEATEVADGRLRLVGVDDPAGLRLGEIKRPADEPALLGPPRAGRFTILLKHQPLPETASLGRFDLMLSGHLHQGQILPFGLLIWLSYPYFSGTHPLPQGSLLHVSRGAGTWGPPMRFGAPPEVTLITLEEVKS